MNTDDDEGNKYSCKDIKMFTQLLGFFIKAAFCRVLD